MASASEPNFAESKHRRNFRDGNAKSVTLLLHCRYIAALPYKLSHKHNCTSTTAQATTAQKISHSPLAVQSLGLLAEAVKG
jgi:hypothetical protein